MNVETISIIISVIMVGAAGGALTMAGFKQSRADMDRRFRETREDVRELRRDVNYLREAVGALNERMGIKTG
ncbi:MAG: hypothetical protein OXF11_01440 [Deltaproteobacteria bacterium]|nr:hypothetical protein [Deltaproteobacteria bacterium]